MAKKVVNATQLDADLLSIADAIREKGGTSAALLFPDEFVTAINDIHGGGGDAYAAISVTYPEGSICTCSQAGQTTITAGDTSGIWLFVVPVGGEWTVTATQGDRTKSQVVSIGEYGQVEHITLQYRLWLFENGDQCVNVTGGWERNPALYATEPNTGGTVTFGNDLYFWTQEAGSIIINTKNAVDISHYSTLNMEITEILEKCRIGVKNVKSGDVRQGDGVETRQTGVVSFDISSYTGEFWIFVGNQTYTGARIPRVWLS